MNPNSLNAQCSSAAERLDLTAAQRGIWYAQKLAPQNPMYQIGQFVEIDGELDVAVLAEAGWRAGSANPPPHQAVGGDA